MRCDYCFIMLIQEKNGSLEQNAEQLKLNTTTLQTELEKHKCVAVTAVASPLKVNPRNPELDHVRKELAKKEMELEKIHKEFESTRKEIETAKAKVAENKLQVGALEAKVSELQALLAKERAQTRAQNLRTEEDKKKIQDLNRQVHISRFHVHHILCDLLSLTLRLSKLAQTLTLLASILKCPV